MPPNVKRLSLYDQMYKIKTLKPKIRSLAVFFHKDIQEILDKCPNVIKLETFVSNINSKTVRQLTLHSMYSNNTLHDELGSRTTVDTGYKVNLPNLNWLKVEGVRSDKKRYPSKGSVQDSDKLKLAINSAIKNSKSKEMTIVCNQNELEYIDAKTIQGKDITLVCELEVITKPIFFQFVKDSDKLVIDMNDKYTTDLSLIKDDIKILDISNTILKNEKLLRTFNDLRILNINEISGESSELSFLKYLPRSLESITLSKNLIDYKETKEISYIRENINKNIDIKIVESPTEYKYNERR